MKWLWKTFIFLLFINPLLCLSAATIDTSLAPEESLPDQTFTFDKIAGARYSTKKM